MSSQSSITRDVETPMPDGAVLRGDVYAPADGGPHPALLVRTPYDKSNTVSLNNAFDVMRAVRAGYAVVAQDVRGRFASDGEFAPFRNEARDGHATIEWLARQDWCDGRIGMFGPSYCGYAQWLAATTQPPHLRAIVPTIATSDVYRDWVYRDGVFALGFNTTWPLASLGPNELARSPLDGAARREAQGALLDAIDGVREELLEVIADAGSFERRFGVAPYLAQWREHPDWDGWWQEVSVAAQRAAIAVPALSIGGWYDVFVDGTVANYVESRRAGATAAARDGQMLVLGPWAHAGTPLFGSMVGAVDFGIRAAGPTVDLNGLALRFLDRWVRDDEDALADEAPVRIFTMGADAWRTESEWPLARARDQRWLLASGVSAHTRHGDGRLVAEADASGDAADACSDAFAYDPADPVPTHGGPMCCWPNAFPTGAFDQSGIEERADVLVYSSAPLTEPVEVTGAVRARLHASSSARATHFTAKLVDVAPDGFARNVCDGVVAARWSAEEEPHAPQELTIELGVTSHQFRAGHAIRLDVSSSNFPRFEPSPEPAQQQVHHGGEHQSALVLPVVSA